MKIHFPLKEVGLPTAIGVLMPVLCCVTPPTAGADAVTAYGPGEKLEYVLKWAGVVAGDSVMAVEEGKGADGKLLYRVVSTAKSRSLIDVFYPVRNRYETHIDPVDGLTRKYVFHQDEGGKLKNRVLVFDQDRGIVTRIVREGGKTSSLIFEIPEDTQDNLSSLYALRNEELKVGESVLFKVFEGKKNWELVVEVLAEEVVDVKAGRFRCLKVHPLLKYEGLFRRKGELHVWVTNDSLHIPVLMKSKVRIGSITAELVRYTTCSERRSDQMGGP